MVISMMDKQIYYILTHNYNVSRETLSKLQNYYYLLTKWNNSINLVSNSSLKLFWHRHILDSIQLLSYIDDKNIVLADLGSGAGFPGMILSILGVRKVLLVESDIRKAAFLLHISKLSSNIVEVINNKVQHLAIHCDIITSRALASVSKILLYSKNFTVNHKYLILKGKDVRQEITQALLHSKFSYRLYPSCMQDHSWILEIENVTRKNS